MVLARGSKYAHGTHKAVSPGIPANIRKRNSNNIVPIYKLLPLIPIYELLLLTITSWTCIRPPDSYRKPEFSVTMCWASRSRGASSCRPRWRSTRSEPNTTSSSPAMDIDGGAASSASGECSLPNASAAPLLGQTDSTHWMARGFLTASATLDGSSTNSSCTCKRRWQHPLIC